MLCCCWGIGETVSIQKPSVIKAAVKSSKQYNSLDNLPPGAILHGAAKLHAAGLTGKGIKVAVIDSGVDKDHPAFEGMVKKTKWYRSGPPLSEDDHGTHVAGTIHFMAPQAEIYDYRVFGTAGTYDVTESIRRAILEAVKDGCHVINMSIGGPIPSPGVQAAIIFATSKGVVCVCAAGNDGDGDPLTNEVSYPASFSECISIAAVSKMDGTPVAPFSNSNVEVDYSGIGVDVVSLKPNGGFQKMSGTSMACPHISGFIAAIMTNKPQEDVDTLRKRLTKRYAQDIGIPGKDPSTGLGFITYLNKVDELPKAFKKIGIKLKSPPMSTIDPRRLSRVMKEQPIASKASKEQKRPTKAIKEQRRQTKKDIKEQQRPPKTSQSQQRLPKDTKEQRRPQKTTKAQEKRSAKTSKSHARALKVTEGNQR